MYPILDVNNKEKQKKMINNYDTTPKHIAYSNLKIRQISAKIGEEIIHGGHLVSTVSPAIAFITMILFNLTISWAFLFISYLGTYIVYNYDHLREAATISDGNQHRSTHIQKNIKLRYLLLAGHILLFFTLLFLYGTVPTIFFGVLLLFSGLLYVDVFKRLTKRIIGFKNIYTSLSIALIPMFTLLFYSYQFNWTFLIYFSFIFLHFFLDTSYCDLKDMNDDKKHQLKTLPLYLGKQKFLTMLHIINLISFILLILSIILHVIPSIASLLLVFCAYRIYYLQMARHEKKDMNFICDVIVDGEYFLWPVLLFFGSSLLSIL